MANLFEMTRRRLIPLDAYTKADGAASETWQIPRGHILTGIYLSMRFTFAGTTYASLAAKGYSALISQVQLIASGGLELINISGPGYFYLLRYYLEDYKNVVPGNDGQTVVAPGSVNLDMYLPVAMSANEVKGLLMLQTEESQFQLKVTMAANSVLATGTEVAITGTVQPTLEVLSVPPSEDALKGLFGLVHVIQEETKTVSAGVENYEWLRGGIYLQQLHGINFKASGPSDYISNMQVRVNENDIIEDKNASLMDMEFGRNHGVARPKGHWGWDGVGSTGLGNYNSYRDLINSANLTSLKSRLTVGTGGTLHSIRRTLNPVDR